MIQILAVVLSLLPHVAESDALEVPWTIWSIVPVRDGLCPQGSVDLFLIREGVDVLQKDLELARPRGDRIKSKWDVGRLDPGLYEVEARVTGCAGERSALHRIQALVTERDREKIIAVYVGDLAGSIVVKYLVVRTILDGNDLFSATEGGLESDFQYLGQDPIEPCPSRYGGVALRYAVEGEWNVDGRDFEWEAGVAEIETGAYLPLSSSVRYIQKWRPKAVFVPPNAKRLTVAVAPRTNAVYPPGSDGSPSFPPCDMFIADLPLLDGEPVFPRLESGESKESQEP